MIVVSRGLTRPANIFRTVRDVSRAAPGDPVVTMAVVAPAALAPLDRSALMADVFLVTLAGRSPRPGVVTATGFSTAPLAT